MLILTGIAGASLGWIIGILMSPYRHELSKFTELAKIAYGFLTGYILSKVDPLIAKLVSVDNITTQNSENSDFAIIVTYFFASFITAISLTYISRSYWTSEEEIKKLNEKVNKNE